MAETMRQHVKVEERHHVKVEEREGFYIHEDIASTADTEYPDEHDAEHEEDDDQMEDGDDHESQEADSSDGDTVDGDIQNDMDKLQDAFPGFRDKFRLIKRIGEGTFSTVYKAEDLQYDRYDNSWDLDKDRDKWSPPPLKGSFAGQSTTGEHRRRRAKYVAIKKIYVTSSPARILNELELLHDVRNCPFVAPLITAFRHTDQVVAILPYCRHADFRMYFRKMTVPDMAIYLRSLFSALAFVHSRNILHRDVKPTNFLYDPAAQRGVLCDFGLAEREGAESKPCMCHDDPTQRRHRLRTAGATHAPQNGYPKQDTRPSRRANRAGTRGFRAPEVLFKCTEQTTKIDIWSVGVILLTILSRRFPFFNSADDVEAMIEIATIFGSKRMKAAGLLHGCMFESNIPTIGQAGFALERIILWSTCRSDTGEKLSDEEKMAVQFLSRCMELDPARRISAQEALDHEFLRLGLDETVENSADGADDDEMDILRV